MEKYDIFSVTSEVLSAIPNANDKYIAAANGQWTVSNSATKAFATYLDTNTKDGITFYAFQVL